MCQIESIWLTWKDWDMLSGQSTLCCDYQNGGLVCVSVIVMRATLSPVVFLVLAMDDCGGDDIGRLGPGKP